MYTTRLRFLSCMLCAQHFGAREIGKAKRCQIGVESRPGTPHDAPVPRSLSSAWSGENSTPITNIVVSTASSWDYHHFYSVYSSWHTCAKCAEWIIRVALRTRSPRRDTCKKCLCTTGSYPGLTRVPERMISSVHPFLVELLEANPAHCCIPASSL
jgi:hypothetical protein